MPRRKRGKSKKINMESRADEPDQNEDETVVDQPADEDEDAISKEAILPIEEDAVSIATEVPVVMIELVLEDAPVDSTTEQSAIEEATPETDDVVAEPNEDPELVEPDDQERSIKDVTVDFIKEDLLGRQQTRKKTYFRQVKTKEELPSGYQRPQRPRPLVKPRKVKAIQLHAWQALIRNDGYVRCPLKYCGREMRSVAGMSAHYLTCKGLPPSNDKFQCGFCGKFQNDEPALVGHMEDAHPEWDTYVVDDNEPVADGDAGGATAQEEPESPPPPVKRPRGRPRKHPLPSTPAAPAPKQPKPARVSDVEEEDEDEEAGSARRGGRRGDPVFRAGAWATPRAPTSIRTRTTAEPEEPATVAATTTPRSKKKAMLTEEQYEAVLEADEREVDPDTRSSIPTDVFDKWKEELRENGYCFCPECTIKRKSLVFISRHYYSCLQAKATSFSCQICGKEIKNKASLNYHFMAEHNGLEEEMRDDDSPDKRRQQMLALKVVLKKQGKLRCQVRDCGRSFLSADGYLYHWKTCGKEVIYVDCELCGKKLKQGSLTYHMRAHALKEESAQKLREEAVKEENGEETPTPMRKRRHAAEKARQIVKKMASDIAESGSKSRDSKKETVLPYKVPDFLPVTPEMLSTWKQELKKNGFIHCEFPNCPSRFDDWQAYRRHYIRCPCSPHDPGSYACLSCSKEYSTPEGIKWHIKHHHTGEADDDYKDQPGSGSSPSDENEDDSIMESGEEGRSTVRRRGKGLVSTHRSKGSMIPVDWFLEQTLNYHNQHYQAWLFPQWVPKDTDWTAVPQEEVDSYLPPEKESPWLQYKASEEDAPQRPRRIRLFQADVDSSANTIMLNAGGPVWGAAWCPTPYGSVRDQYVAIASHRTYEETHRVTQTSPPGGRGLIQLWKVGTLDVLMADDHVIEPQLALAIAHDWGGVARLEWCPSGGWEDPSTQHAEAGRYPRLGLLAAVCSDGRVRIISVPHPSFVTGTGEQPMRVRPALVLEQNKARLAGPRLSPCLCLAWNPGFAHARIVVGYADGHVAVFDLNTVSPLLKVTVETDNNVIYPHRTFLASMGAIRDLAWCPATGSHLAVATDDRELSIWHLADTAYPINVHSKRGLLTGCAWMAQYAGVFSSQDDCYNFEHNNTHFIDYGYFGTHCRAISAHNGCVWAVSASEWLNTVASGDSAGEVVAVVLPDMINTCQHTKSFPHRRFSACSITQRRLTPQQEEPPCTDAPVCNGDELPPATDSSSAADAVPADKQTLKKEKVAAVPTPPRQEYPEEFERMPMTYDEFRDDWCLVYEELDLSITLKGDKKLTYSHAMPSAPVNGIPMRAIHRVAWNPNLGAHSWLLMAGYSGLVQIVRVATLERNSKRFVSKARDSGLVQWCLPDDSMEEDEEEVMQYSNLTANGLASNA